MKKVIITMILTVISVSGYAYQKQMDETSVDTVIVKTDPIDPNQDQGSPHRGAESSVFIIQEGFTLFFNVEFSGCTISLLDENELTEYSGVVGSDGIVVLPEYLEGVFELQLTVDNIVYSGEIQLE